MQRILTWSQTRMSKKSLKCVRPVNKFVQAKHQSRAHPSLRSKQKLQKSHQTASTSTMTTIPMMKDPSFLSWRLQRKVKTRRPEHGNMFSTTPCRNERSQHATALLTKARARQTLSIASHSSPDRPFTEEENRDASDDKLENSDYIIHVAPFLYVLK